VLANDTDPENDTLSAVLVSGPANASSFTLNADGSFSYTHNGSETTTDSFTYLANDGTANSNVATVTITITPVSDAPVAVNDAYGVNEGGTLNVAAPGVLVNDTDAENDALTAVLVSGPSNAASFSLNADGSFAYVHNGSETLTDSFTYRANDGTSNSNVATVTITITPVNDAPIANNDGPYSVSFHGTVNVPPPGVLGNDTDAEGNSMIAVLVSSTSQGILVLNPDGSFSYTHTGATLGSDSFTYVAQDSFGAQSAPATVTINIVSFPPTCWRTTPIPTADRTRSSSAPSTRPARTAAPSRCCRTARSTSCPPSASPAPTPSTTRSATASPRRRRRSRSRSLSASGTSIRSRPDRRRAARPIRS
jgi:VCBS repeat-containing protein